MKNTGIELLTKFAQIGDDFELKMESDEAKFEGYASLFEQVDLGGDMVMPGAYRKSINKRGPRRIRMLWQHDPSKPIGRFEVVEEDQKGLIVKGSINTGSFYGSEVASNLKFGAIDGLSIGYRTVDADRAKIGTRQVRQLKELDLWEISFVTFPMQVTARAKARKAEDFQNPRTVEQVLRDAGCPHKTAKRIAADGMKASDRDDDGGDANTLSAFADAMRSNME
jgi:HK97 family phage prohead protease